MAKKPTRTADMEFEGNIRSFDEPLNAERAKHQLSNMWKATQPKIADAFSKILRNQIHRFVVKKYGKAMAKKWIQSAVNPAHKGYCSPMSKKTCTPRRKALAKRFKAGGDLHHAKGKRAHSSFPKKDANGYY